MYKQRLAVLISSAVGMLSIIMPWAIIPLVGNMSGFNTTSGKILLVLFFVPIVFSLIGNKKDELAKWMRVIIIITSILSILSIILQYASFGGFGKSNESASAIFNQFITIGFGIYVAGISALATLFLVILIKAKRKTVIQVVNANSSYKESRRVPDRNEEKKVVQTQAQKTTTNTKQSTRTTTSAQRTHGNANDIITAVKNQSISQKEFKPSDHSKYMPKED